MIRSCKLLFYLLLAGTAGLAGQDESTGEPAPGSGEEEAPSREEAPSGEASEPESVSTSGDTPPADGETAVTEREATVDPGLSPSERAASLVSEDGKVHVYRVPMTEAISKPNLFILRRSIKQAIERDVQVLVLDMDTPGGRLDVTLDMMELLDRFEGETITYVNKDSISAGAYISMATDAIYFAPDGVMGAAAVVSGGGQEIDESMKAKINSYLLARMRSYTETYPYREDVIRAMA